MKYIDEYRDTEQIRNLSQNIFKITAAQWNIMEICGGQTHTIMKYNLESLLPDKINLIHGPGCPVCVTPVEMIDKVICLARRNDVIITSFGDMLRVPGSEGNLLLSKADGGDVRIVYSPLEGIKIAEENPGKEVVFFAVGFETTAPANAAAIKLADEKGLKNYSVLCAHVLVPPAIELLLSSQGSRINGILAAGHVCSVMGTRQYELLSKKYNVPIVVTGFEPYDILQGIYSAVRQLENNIHGIENQYGRAVSREGNTAAQKIMSEVFELTDRKWRGIGIIPSSGLKIKEEFSSLDAELKYELTLTAQAESADCIAGSVLQGLLKPNECGAFGNKCKPEHPLGAPMVSSEGVCASYYNYRLINYSNPEPYERRNS